MEKKPHQTIYEPYKILSFIEEKEKITPSDLEEFGYGYRAAINLLIWLKIQGYVETDGFGYAREPAYFKTEEGKIKKVAGGRIQNTFVLTEKGIYEKPEKGVMWHTTTIPLTWD